MKLKRRRILGVDGRFGNPFIEADLSNVSPSQLNAHLDQLKALIEAKKAK